MNARRAGIALGLVLAAVGLLPVGSCLDDQFVSPDAVTTVDKAFEPTASNPVTFSPETIMGAAARRSATLVFESDVAYVSLPPGTVPEGGIATIRNARLNVDVTAAVQDGGFDPVSIVAEAGDILLIDVQQTGGAVVRLSLSVPRAARPRVVRANPPPRKRDVPLNTPIVVVFSEPLLAGSETGIVLRHSGAPVLAGVTLAPDGLRAEINVNGLLAPITDYEILIPATVRDRSGDAIETAVSATFTTGTTQIVASVATDPAAIVVNPFSGQLRTFTMTAVLDDDGRYSGSWSIFYPGSGTRVFGRVACFTIVGGNTVWAAGIAEAANDTTAIGREFGWRAVDDGPSGNGTDQLSLAHPLADDSLTASDYCASVPDSLPVTGAILLNDLVSGQVVVNSSGPPPPPQTGLSEIAFAAWPNGGIQVIKADGSSGRLLTAGEDWHPAWSPDASKIAFHRVRSDRSQADIYSMNADGSDVRQLTSGAAYNGDAAWSPDGQEIAYHSNGSLFVMRAATGAILRRLTTLGCDWQPSWSPDGSRIAFSSCRAGDQAIFVMNADGTGVSQITSGPSDWWPAWSPDGRRIVFQRGDCCERPAIYAINPDGSGLAQVAVEGRTPAWSPDSRGVVFELFGLNAVRSDGTGLHRLGNGFDPAWSPTGSVPPMPPLALSVALAVARDTLVVGDTVLIAVTARDAAGNPMHGRVAAWTNSDPTVASIPEGYSSEWGLAAIGVGTTRIIATIDGKSDTVVVHVIPR